MSSRLRIGTLVILALWTVSPAWAQDALTRAPEVMEPYNEGVQLLAEGKFKEALGPLNAAIAADGTFPDAYLAKADAYKALKDYQNAIGVYSRALEMSSSLSTTAQSAAHNGRGESYMEMTPPDYNMAFNDFTNAVDLDRGNASALSNMGHILVNFAQDPQRGLDLLDETLSLNPQDARAYRDRGLGHAMLREFDEAEGDLQKAIETDPGDYENYWTLATIYQLQNKFAEASDAIGKAITAYKPKKRIEPKTFVMGYINRADALLRLAEMETDPAKRKAALEGVVADADAVLAEYEDRFPEAGRALYRRGRAQRLLEQYVEAVDSLTGAIQGVPLGQAIEYQSDAYLFRGICFFHIGSYDLARGDFEAASSIGNGFQDPRVFLWIGYTHHKQGDYRQAVEAYSQAISKQPDFALAHVNKGRAYMDLREYKKAIESFNNAIRSEPDVGDHYYNVGVACNKLEDFKQAEAFLKLALRKDNPQPKMYRAMATTLRGLGRDELAEQYEKQSETPAGAATGG